MFNCFSKLFKSKPKKQRENLKPPYNILDEQYITQHCKKAAPFIPSEEINDHYAYLWDTMKIQVLPSQTLGDLSWVTVFISNRSDWYKEVAAYVYSITQRRVPWEVIAVLHNKEGGSKKERQILNGQKWSQMTTMIPVGLGPWESFEESCAYAFATRDLPEVWTIENTLYFLEAWNGFGYSLYHRESVGETPYLWSFSQHYKGGLYVSDGKFDKKAVAKSIGAAVMLSSLGYNGDSRLC